MEFGGDTVTDWVQKQMDRIRQEQAEEDQKGGPGSGHFGHAGRPGKRGGSQPGKGGGGGASGGGGEEAPARGGGGRRTAAAAYQEHREAITGHLGSIRSGLKKHATEFKKEPKNWGYYGDLTNYRARLGEALDFITGAEEGTNWGSEQMQRESRELRGKSAREGYDKAMWWIKDMLKTMDASVKKHQGEFFGTDQRDWGWAGDLSEVRAKLKDIDDSLHGTGEYAEE